MADDMVAWSPIKSAKNNGTPSEPDMEEVTIAPGESVTAEALGLDDEQWAQQIEAGTVRKMKYPEMPETFQGSPIDFLRQQAREAAEGALMEAAESEENISAIAIANAASTGVALPEPVEEASGPSASAQPAAAKAGDNK